MTSVPLWIRALQWVDRLAWYAYRTEEVVRDELMRAWVDPRLRAVVTDAAYAKQESYLPGGSTYQRGLFEWEIEALASPLFPRRGRLLLGAAGGGRELASLCERGFEVVAFEPNDRLRGGANEVARKYPTASVVAASYDDLVRAANDRTGPLAGALTAGPFDAVVLGWGSITHLVTPGDHRALLRAVRVACPAGPILVSFFMRPPGPAPAKGKSDRLRGGLRSMFAALGAPAAPDGLGYEMDGGFVYYFTDEEVHRLAFEAGYEIAHLRASPFPHAILTPLASSR